MSKAAGVIALVLGLAVCVAQPAPRCEEDMACWIGSANDDRTPAEQEQARQEYRR